MNARDFAVVAAINKYKTPTEFRDLGGPEHDAADFIDWLKSPAGADVPAANIDPFTRLATNGVGPTRSDIEAAFSDLFNCARPQDQPIGRRLYVFLAGHGFTTSKTLSLLHAYESRKLTPFYVSGFGWLECFYNTALFDELVLFMDCCRDFEPTASAPIRPCLGQVDTAAQNVKQLVLLATGLGLQAYEREIDGKPRGLFSHAVTTALRSDAVDGDGRITAANVVQSVRRSLAPRAAAGLNQIPDPICSPDFVLFDNLAPRRAEVRLRFPGAGYTVQLYRGNDTHRQVSIALDRMDGNDLVFQLPCSKTYFADPRDPAGVRKQTCSFEVETDRKVVDVDVSQ